MDICVERRVCSAFREQPPNGLWLRLFGRAYRGFPPESQISEVIFRRDSKARTAAVGRELRKGREKASNGIRCPVCEGRPRYQREAGWIDLEATGRACTRFHSAGAERGGLVNHI